MLTGTNRKEYGPVKTARGVIEVTLTGCVVCSKALMRSGCSQ